MRFRKYTKRTEYFLIVTFSEVYLGSISLLDDEILVSFEIYSLFPLVLVPYALEYRADLLQNNLVTDDEVKEDFINFLILFIFSSVFWNMVFVFFLIFRLLVSVKVSTRIIILE